MNKLPNKKNKNILQLIRGSSLNTLVKLLATLLGFFATTQVARHYGPSVVGNIATISSVLTILSLISLTGNQTFVLKAIPQQLQIGGFSSAQTTYKKILKICLYTTVSICSVWLAVEIWLPPSLLKGMGNYVYFTVALIFIQVYFILNGRVLRALGDYKIFSLLDFLPALFSVLMITLAISIGLKPTTYQYVHFLPKILLAALGFYFVLRAFKKIGDTKTDKIGASDSPSKRTLLRTSIPMLGITISTAAIAHLDIIMLNYFSSATTVGIYSTYVKLVSVTAMATVSINAMFAPKAAELYASDRHMELQSYSKQVTLLSFSAVVTLTAILLLIHHELLGYFGTQFLDDLPALYILLASNVTITFFGSVGFYLSMTGNQSIFFWIVLCAAILNVAANLLLIPIYGIYGAAISTLLANLTTCVLATLKIKSLRNYTLIWITNTNPR